MGRLEVSFRGSWCVCLGGVVWLAMGLVTMKTVVRLSRDSLIGRVAYAFVGWWGPNHDLPVVPL